LVDTCAQPVLCMPLLQDGRKHRVISRLVRLMLLRKCATLDVGRHAIAPCNRIVLQVQYQVAVITDRRGFCRISSNGRKLRISTVSTQLSPSVIGSGRCQSVDVLTAPQWNRSHQRYRVGLHSSGLYWRMRGYRGPEGRETDSQCCTSDRAQSALRAPLSTITIPTAPMLSA
jgi:uncharacterized protein (UPF0179 family)